MIEYQVWENGDPEEDAITMHAVDTESAALAWAAWYDNESAADYPIASSGTERRILVRTENGVEEFSVFGEVVPHYRATRRR